MFYFHLIVPFTLTKENWQGLPSSFVSLFFSFFLSFFLSFSLSHLFRIAVSCKWCPWLWLPNIAWGYETEWLLICQVDFILLVFVVVDHFGCYSLITHLERWYLASFDSIQSILFLVSDRATQSSVFPWTNWLTNDSAGLASLAASGPSFHCRHSLTDFIQWGLTSDLNARTEARFVR